MACLTAPCSTGYGQHGDYVFGWKGDALQKAMDGGCFGPSCAGLKTQAYADANKCKVADYINEEKDGCELSPPRPPVPPSPQYLSHEDDVLTPLRQGSLSCPASTLLKVIDYGPGLYE